MDASRFFLGTHEPTWLRKTDVPLFVSRRRLDRVFTRPPAARGSWCLDSGGFTELSMFGGWQTTPEAYLDDVYWGQSLGGLDWVAPQDWMCEPIILQKTGLTVQEHQRRTVENYLYLQKIQRGLHIIPVLQGWESADYLRCADMYRAAGVDLETLPTVGLGTVCRRQGTKEAAQIITDIRNKLPSVRLHGFGFKTLGLLRCGHLLHSADSLAWSYRARKAGQQLGCKHKSCSNCMIFALQWRESLLARLGYPGTRRALSLF